MMSASCSNTSLPLVIAVDGTSASGKGTLAKKLAKAFNFAYLDTGALYRAVALAVLRAGLDAREADQATRVAVNVTPEQVQALTDDPALRDEATSVAASQISVVPEVRTSLLKFQQDFCAHPPDAKEGAVLDGRDIGTVIAPTASAKLFITADPATRAARRYKELRARGENVTEARVFEDMRARDQRDAERAVAPTKPAADAVTLDTTHLNADEVFTAAIAIIEPKLGRRAGRLV
jgi:cytidylate kinase